MQERGENAIAADDDQLLEACDKLRRHTGPAAAMKMSLSEEAPPTWSSAWGSERRPCGGARFRSYLPVRYREAIPETEHRLSEQSIESILRSDQ